MGYEPTTWHGGDVLSAEAMNKIENGIANAGTGALEVRVIIDGDTLTLNKTWQEIYDAFPNIYGYVEIENLKVLILSVGVQNNNYFVEGWFNGSMFFNTDSPNGYPGGGEIIE